MDSLNPVDFSQIREQITALDLKRAAVHGARGKTVDEAARDFEAMVATQLMAPMMETLPIDETFGGGVGEETFRGFLMQEYGRIAAQTGSMGISDSVRDVMLRVQADQQGKTATPGPS